MSHHPTLPISSSHLSSFSQFHHLVDPYIPTFSYPCQCTIPSSHRRAVPSSRHCTIVPPFHYFASLSSRRPISPPSHDPAIIPYHPTIPSSHHPAITYPIVPSFHFLAVTSCRPVTAPRRNPATISIIPPSQHPAVASLHDLTLTPSRRPITAPPHYPAIPPYHPPTVPPTFSIPLSHRPIIPLFP